MPWSKLRISKSMTVAGTMALLQCIAALVGVSFGVASAHTTPAKHPQALTKGVIPNGMPTQALSAECNKQTTLRYVNASTLAVLGRAFNDTQNLYERLPASAEGRVRPAVWGKSQAESHSHSQSPVCHLACPLLTCFVRLDLLQ